jgi:hypothetical protein
MVGGWGGASDAAVAVSGEKEWWDQRAALAGPTLTQMLAEKLAGGVVWEGGELFGGAGGEEVAAVGTSGGAEV